MIAQYYAYPKEDYVRVFLGVGLCALMDCYLRGSRDLCEADKALNICGVRRRTRWIKTPWGYEAGCRWKEGEK